MSYDKKKLAAALQNILKNCSDTDGPPENPTGSILFGGGTTLSIGDKKLGSTKDDGSPTIFLTTAALSYKSEFVNECMKDPELSLRVGERQTGAQVDRAIRQLWPMQDRGDLEAAIKSLILKPLRDGIKEWTIVAPIAGLKVSTPTTIGGTTFLPAANGLVSGLTRILANNPGQSPDYTPGTAFSVGNLYHLAERGTAWAETRIRSHAGKIVDVAHSKLERSISVVRAFTHVFHKRDSGVIFGLPHELPDGTVGLFCYDDSTITFQNEHRSSPEPFSLNDKVADHLRTHFSLDLLSTIAESEPEPLNSLHKAIGVSLIWLSRSVTSQSRSEALTNCTIALERLLITDQEETTTEKLADRTAFLVADTPEARHRVHAITKRLYDLRSKVVHAGLGGVEIDEVVSMERLAHWAIAKVAELAKSLPSHDSLREHLHRKKLE